MDIAIEFVEICGHSNIATLEKYEKKTKGQIKGILLFYFLNSPGDLCYCGFHLGKKWLEVFHLCLINHICNLFYFSFERQFHKDEQGTSL